MIYKTKYNKMRLRRNNNRFTLYAIYIVLCFMCCFMSGCVKEDLTNFSKSNFEISLNIPSEFSNVTRASTQELSIKRGYVIVYNSDKSVCKRVYPIDITKITGNGTVNPKITILGGVISQNDVVVLILNPKDKTASITVAYNNLNTEFQLDGTGFETTANGIPMSGEFVCGVDSNNVTIARAVAKIEIVIDGSLGGTHASGFTASSVKYEIYNNVTKGNMLSGHVTTNNGTPTTSIGTDFNFIKTLSSAGASYIYEFSYSNRAIGGGDTPISTTDFVQNRLAVILKKGTGGTARYYRLDLRNIANNGFLDIERNKHYKVNITSVNSDGHATATEALKSLSSNITATITDNIGDIMASNGDYAISLKKSIDTWAIYGDSPTAIEFEVGQVKYIKSGGGGALPSSLAATITLSGSTAGVSVVTAPQTLTDTYQSIMLKVTPSAVASGVVKYSVKFGNLTLDGSFDITKGGGATVDCHPCVVDLGGGDVFSLPENITPVSWVVRNASDGLYVASDGSNVDAVPIFEDKTVTGSLFSSSGSRVKYFIQQKAPEYIGRFGSPLTVAEGDYDCKRLIVESIEETGAFVRDNGGEAIGVSSYGIIKWCKDEIVYGVLNEMSDGLKITEEFGKSYSTLETPAARYCYLKNDLDGNGIVDADEPVNWYLPALNQLAGVWITYKNITNSFVAKRYWSATEDNIRYSRYVDFSFGKMNSDVKINGKPTRCVRDM